MGRITGAGVVVVGAGVGRLTGEVIGGLADESGCLVDWRRDIERFLDTIIPMCHDRFERVRVLHNPCLDKGRRPHRRPTSLLETERSMTYICSEFGQVERKA